jgi:hypothetical protein
MEEEQPIPRKEDQQQPTTENVPVDLSGPSNFNDQPQTQMEVHHHPNLHHKPKKWKEYFLEFLMIFLAVTLGFIAENIREHFTDRAKERQYIAGFVSNLKDDTANLRQIIEFDRHLIKGIDSMLMLSHVNMSIDSNRKSFYYIALHYFYGTASFKSNDATLQQLKSTGDYRLIERDHVADSLTRYDASIQGIYRQGAYYETYFNEILSRLDDMTDMTIISDSSYVKDGKMTGKTFPLLRVDDGKLRTFFNKIFDFTRITGSYADDFLVPQLENSKNLIEFLKREYKIEELQK